MAIFIRKPTPAIWNRRAATGAAIASSTCLFAIVEWFVTTFSVAFNKFISEA